MWRKTDDGSVLDATGRVLFFSLDRFVRDICLGNSCFICGAHPTEKRFNNEHILPEWVLRRYDLFDRTITLPNGSAVKYGRYTVPCCADCNSLMGEEIERPISQVIRGGSKALHEFLARGGILNLIVWAGLIFLKTHLKDRVHRVHLDTRKGQKKISDSYDWTTLHHLHCIVRCFYSRCAVEESAVGSFLVVPVKPQVAKERFDFGDLYLAQTMLLRLDDLAIVAVFDDSGAAMNFIRPRLEKITGPISELQLREIMIELAYLNLQLQERPVFRSEFDLEREKCRIVGSRPSLKLRRMNYGLRGKLMLHAVGDALPYLSTKNLSTKELVKAVKKGRFTFLFDNEGRFIDSDWVPLPPTGRSRSKAKASKVTRRRKRSAKRR